MVLAQELPVPYLCNGKYGLANAQAELISPCIYDEMLGHGNAPFYSVKREKLWGIINAKGEVIFPLSINLESTYRHDYGPDVMPLFEWRMTTKGSWDYIQTGLYSLEDIYTGSMYYFNPDFRNNHQKAYAIKTEGPIKWADEFAENRVGLWKVKSKEGKFNFLNKQGNEVLEKDVFDGAVVAENLFVVADSAHRLGLYSRTLNSLSPHFYSSILATANKSIIQLVQYPEKDSPSLYHAYAINGKFLGEQKNISIYVNGQNICIQDTFESRLIDTSGNIVAVFTEGKLDPLDDIFWKLKTIDNKMGIVSLNGNVLAEPKYSELLAIKKDRFGYYLGGKGGIMDSQFHEIWSLDSAIVCDTFFYLKGYYKIKNPDTQPTLFGVVDSAGQIVIHPKYSRIDYSVESGLFLVSRDSVSAIFDRQGLEILPETTSLKKFNHYRKVIVATYPSEEREYSYNGILMKSHLAWKPLLRILHMNRKSYLASPDSIPLTEAIYFDLRKYEDFETRTRIYVGYIQESNTYQILSEEGKLICPEGFELQMDNFNQPEVEAGLIFVVHSMDVEANILLPRSGVISYTGDWILEPSNIRLRRIRESMFVVTSEDQSKFPLYNRYGDVLTTKPYSYSAQGNGLPLQHNRLIVMYGADSIAYANFLRHSSDITLYRSGAKTMVRGDRGNEIPQFVYGFIDSAGHEVIPPVYSFLEQFRTEYTTGSKIDSNGKSHSYILDLNGHAKLTTDYDRLSFLENNLQFLKCEKDGLVGIIDTNGVEYVPAAYTSVEPVQSMPGVFMAKDMFYSYILFSDGGKQKIGPNASIEVKGKGGFRITSISGYENGKKSVWLHFFNKTGNHLRELSGLEVASGPFSEMLDDEYIALKKLDNPLPFAVHMSTGRFFTDQ